MGNSVFVCVFWAQFLRPVSFCTAQPRGTCVCMTSLPHLPRPDIATGLYLMSWSISRPVRAADGPFCICLCFLGPFSETGLVLHGPTPWHMRVHDIPSKSAKIRYFTWDVFDVLDCQQACAGIRWGVLYLFVFSGHMF